MTGLSHFEPSPAYLIICMAWLECPKEEIVVAGDPNDFFGEELPEGCREEMWALPPTVVVELDMDGVEVRRPEGGFTFGRIVLGTFNGHRFIAEQCASPWLLHWRGQ